MASAPVPRSEDGFSASNVAPAATGNVTLSQAQFDMLCNKLHGLEDNITQLRNEISRNSRGRTASDNHDPALYAPREEAPNPGQILSNGQVPNGDGKAPQFQRHAALHGIHAKNELVRISEDVLTMMHCKLTLYRAKRYISAQVPFPLS